MMCRVGESETVETFACFGGNVTLIVLGAGPAGRAGEAVATVRRRLLEWHSQFSRFEPASELSLLNADPGETVAVSPVMARFVVAARDAAAATGGLVDPTLLREIEGAGYRDHFDGASLPLRQALALAPARAPARPAAAARWREVGVDPRRGVVMRPPGVAIDSGGIAKGLFGDILSGVLDGHAAYVIECAGDIRLGGSAEVERPVGVASPFDDSILHSFALRRGAVATSGIGRRSWLDEAGRPAHHLLDPSTGRPAYTGIVQVTALAPSGVEAEWRAKAALLSGPGGAERWLGHGGLVVYDDGRFELLAAGA